jgi:hypothetical protein
MSVVPNRETPVGDAGDREPKVWVRGEQQRLLK